MKPTASTFLVLLLLAAACGGPSRGASAPAASNQGCDDRVRAFTREAMEIVEYDTPEWRARDEKRIALAKECPGADQEMLLGGAHQASPSLVATWQAQVDAHPEDAAVLGNAGALRTGTYDDEALAYFERAEAAAPTDARWPERQAHILERLSERGTDKALTDKAYAKFQRAAELSDADRRFDMRGDLAKAALAAGRFDEAKAHADEILAHIGSTKASWNTGNLIYDAHTTLGRIALRNGDVAAAKAHLLAAGKTPGSPQLGSFGPDFTLAIELLDKGERTTVDEYLALVDKFWEMGHSEITTWRAQLARGESPTFR